MNTNIGTAHATATTKGITAAQDARRSLVIVADNADEGFGVKPERPTANRRYHFAAGVKSPNAIL